MSKTIVAAGDLYQQVHLVQDDRAIREVRFHRSPGGVLQLQEMIETSCEGLPVTVTGPHRQDSNACAYSNWGLIPSKRTEKRRVWRLVQELGVDVPSTASACRYEGNQASPDFLIIHHEALGFANTPQHWPAALREGGKPGTIVLHAQEPLWQGPLWERLWDGFRERLTVILSVDHLRAKGATISRGLSWDLAVEQTVKEMSEGNSSRDLAHCHRVIVAFGTSGTAVFSRGKLERFLYDAHEVEGRWESERPGRSLPVSLWVAAAVVRHETDKGNYPLFIALSDALNCASYLHEKGSADSDGHFQPDAWKQILRRFCITTDRDKDKPERRYSSVFSHDLLSDKEMRKQHAGVSNLLRDATGFHPEYVAAKAMEVVLFGPEAVLEHVPRARYGDFFTVDREEIERLNAISGLIEGYTRNSKDRRPLSLAVFGPPGSGKSFAIKQLAKEMFGEEALLLEFNLSQFQEWDDLVTAFHQVRDGAARGKIPFVFWDEFDTEDFKWLKHFLAPMQDAEFQSGGHSFPFGQALFVFAGGCAPTMGEFETKIGTRKEIKGPDFLSRLRGFVDVKGPNPIIPEGHEEQLEKTDSDGWTKAAREDVAHLIRRAVMLRIAISRFHRELIHEGTNIAAISPAVVHAFLRVKKFLYGARSLETIVSLSRAPKSGLLGPSDLPPSGVIEMHVSKDFHVHLRAGQLGMPVIEALAQACHKAWKDVREKQGWRKGCPRNDKEKIHPWLVEYELLPEEAKERNRVTALVTEAKVHSIGYRDEQSLGSSHPASAKVTKKDMTKLMEIEHDLWLRARLLDGYEYASTTRLEFRQHRDVVAFDKLDLKEQEVDLAIAKSIAPVLVKWGYKLVRATPTRA